MARVWVADTSALLEVRRYVRAADGKHPTAWKGIFAKLDPLATAATLVYPVEVHTELKLGNEKLKEDAKRADYAFHFVDRHRSTAQKRADLAQVKALQADTLVRRIVDPDAEDDEADIYVLAVAVELREGGDDVCVLTQERKDIPKKLSMATACGALDLICLSMQGFLHRRGIWQMP